MRNTFFYVYNTNNAHPLANEGRKEVAFRIKP